jgi:hypothetical protein
VLGFCETEGDVEGILMLMTQIEVEGIQVASGDGSRVVLVLWCVILVIKILFYSFNNKYWVH